MPLPFGDRRARRRLEAEGFADVGIHWPGPLPWRLPHFWLPVESPAAGRHLLATHPPAGIVDRALRILWRPLAALGLLSPLVATGRLGGGERGDPITAALEGCSSTMLLTPGRRSVNKVIGLAFRGGEPEAVIKVARVPEAQAGLEREARVLRELARRRDAEAVAPRVLATGSRAGMYAVLETAVLGRQMLEALTEDTFPRFAEEVTTLLLGLASRTDPADSSGWRQRLVEEHLAKFLAGFGSVFGGEEEGRLRAAVEGLGPLAPAFEHRDCSPWNLVIGKSGPALLDWESAEPDGLPLLDLVYFLANAAFVLDGAIESGRTRDSYARLLDRESARGRVAAGAVRAYTEAVGIGPDAEWRLRTLCWLVHCRSDLAHLRLEHGERPAAERLEASPFLGLLREELSRAPA